MNSLETLDRLHKSATRRRIGYVEAQKRWTNFGNFSRAVALKLSFDWEVIGTSNPANNHNGSNYGCDHIVLRQDATIGRFSRKAGDALCKPAKKFNGNLWVSPSKDAFPTCKACLKRAVQIVEGDRDASS